jgi:hypothetical protein
LFVEGGQSGLQAGGRRAGGGWRARSSPTVLRASARFWLSELSSEEAVVISKTISGLTSGWGSTSALSTATMRRAEERSTSSMVPVHFH